MTVSDFLAEAFSHCQIVKNSYFCSYGNTELDYASFDSFSGQSRREVDIDDWFEITVTPGACEGAYLEIYMWHWNNNENIRYRVGTIKTLQTTLEAYQDLGKLGGEMMYHMLHINIRGK